MSQYNDYAKKLNVAFQTAATKQHEAYDKYTAAEKTRNAGVQIKEEAYPGEITAEKAKIEADYLKAKSELNATQRSAWKDFYDTRDKLGRELEKEADKNQLAEPDDLDNNALTLLKSGTLTAADIENLYNKYDNNATMRRIIGAEAKKLADDTEDIEERRTLSAIAYDSRNARPGILAEWDSLARVSSRYSGETSRDKDPGYICKMCDHWTDENVQKAISNF